MKFEYFIRKELSTNILKEFFKKQNKTYLKTLDESIKFIENSDEFSQEDITNLISDSVKYGSRRILYISKLSKLDSTKISSHENTLKALKKMLHIENDILDFDILNSKKANQQKEVTKPTLEYLKRYRDEDNKSITKIELCFTNIVKIPDKSKESISYTYEKQYIWIDIFTTQKIICFRVPSYQEAFGLSHQSNSLYNEYADKIRVAFGINYLNISDYDEVLYKIFNDIISVSEEPFKQKLENQEQFLNSLTTSVMEKELFSKKSSGVDFKERLKDLIERMIIQENFKEYMSYSQNKDGLISQMQFTDETGGSVNASAGSRIGKGSKIELCDVFFDTRRTIHNNKKVDILWIEWFKHIKNSESREEGSKSHKSVTTKFMVSSKYLIIHFQRILLTREVEEYVFSKLTKYQEFKWYQTKEHE